jgi:hypothetical protein
MEETAKEKIWKSLKKLAPNEPANMVQMSKKIGCSLSYISAIMRYSFESGFLKFDENGNYIKKKLPDYKLFNAEVNKKYTKYRKESKGRGVPRTSRTIKIPKEFKISEENIVPVISLIVKENRELKEKLNKVMSYAKKIKTERDSIMKGLEAFDE